MSRQAGFTALEVIIAVALVATLTATLLGPFGAYVDQAQKEDSRVRLHALRAALEVAYRREIMTVGSAGGAALHLGGVDLPNAATLTPALVAPLERYASQSAVRIQEDGFHQPHRLFVSNELTESMAGTVLPYRIVALVSVGRDGVLQSSFDVATGALTLAGDDLAEVIHGEALIHEVYDEAMRKLRALGQAYQSYFWARYQANPTHSVDVDYFASTDPTGAVSDKWDASGAVRSSAGGAADADAVNLPVALGGLSLDDVTTATGQVIQVDNSSSSVNQPDQSDPTRALPPFSARLIAVLPPVAGGGANGALTSGGGAPSAGGLPSAGVLSAGGMPSAGGNAVVLTVSGTYQ